MVKLDTLAAICDHTFLTPVEALRGQGNAVELRRQTFNRFLEETLALPHLPYSICVRIEDCPHVKQAIEEQQLPIKIASIAGFPDGSWVSTQQKVLEAQAAMRGGADEVDMVINWEALKEGRKQAVLSDLKEVAEAVHTEGGLLKVIVEACVLTADEIKLACELCDQAGADFAKSNTGFHSSGATPEGVALLAKHFPRGIKMSGGITLDNVEELLEATGMEAPYDPMKLRIGESKLLLPVTV